MLPPKAVAAIVFIWTVAAFLGGLYEMDYLGGTEQALLNKVLFYQIVTTEGTWGATELAGGPLGYMEALWRFSTFQFSFISGDWELFHWALSFIGAYFVYGMIMTVVSILRGTIGSS